ncbi:MAG: HRDC domain-containing protein [Anaerolineae bacterium]|nr:HRDC domain-containing protein [Anaerolineae bacterium]
MAKYLPLYKHIVNREQWLACLQQMRQEPRLGLDLEANSLHAYHERICLIQISTSVTDYIIDPMALPDFAELGEIIADPGVEKIFHAAEYDLMLLKRQHGWELNHLFDTMWAARILGLKQVGLANLLHHYFGVEQNKKHQRANWCARPLTREQLIYAQIDSHYLLALRDRLADALHQTGRWEEAQEIFAEHSRVNAPPLAFDPDGFWNINGCRDLSPRQQAVLKALYLFRNEEADRRNHPPYRVFSDRTALELAQFLPDSLEELAEIYGMSPGQINRYGRKLLQLIREGQRAAPPPRPPQRNERPPDEVAARYELLHQWRKKRAIQRGVESDVVLSRDALWALARTRPRTLQQLAQLTELGPVRQRLYGEELVKLLNQ